MVVKKFPPVEQANEDGLLAVGGDLEVETLLTAYTSGIFPWPSDNLPLLWFAPDPRAILDFKDFHIPRRFERELKKNKFSFQMDRDFAGVIRECAISPYRGEQTGTWITPEMVEAYTRFHKAGYAHSFEAYNNKGELVGGLYGVMIGKFFAGESMFFKESGASKFVLVHTVRYLKSLGISWMDIQMVTPTTELFGAKEISRKLYMQRLRKVLPSPLER